MRCVSAPEITDPMSVGGRSSACGSGCTSYISELISVAHLIRGWYHVGPDENDKKIALQSRAVRSEPCSNAAICPPVRLAQQHACNPGLPLYNRNVSHADSGG